MRLESDEDTIGVCDRWRRGIHMKDRRKSRMLIIDGGQLRKESSVIEDRLRESHRDLTESR